MPSTNTIKYCLEEGCQGSATFKGYCRVHYIKNWKYIKMQQKLHAEKKLNEYIERLVEKYPKDYMKIIKEDLAANKDLSELLAEADVHEADDSEHYDEDTRDLIENIKKNIKG